jgi:hypothetical protein
MEFVFNVSDAQRCKRFYSCENMIQYGQGCFRFLHCVRASADLVHSLSRHPVQLADCFERPGRRFAIPSESQHDDLTIALVAGARGHSPQFIFKSYAGWSLWHSICFTHDRPLASCW